MSLARVAGAFYVITFVSGTMSLLTPMGRQINNIIAPASYIAVTVLFYYLFRPVNRTIALVAAVISLAGCVVSALSATRLVSAPFNPLVLFGIYCLLIGYLVFTSTYLPSAIGVLMIFGGVGWLTFALPTLSRALTPYNLAPGMLGEGVLTLWLLIVGVDAARWNVAAERAR